MERYGANDDVSANFIVRHISTKPKVEMAGLCSTRRQERQICDGSLVLNSW